MSKKINILLVSAIFFVAGCDYLPTAKNKALSAVKESLLDPSSAIFSDVFEGKNQGDYCGYVSGKNMLGAYTGKNAFVYNKIWADTGKIFLASEPLTDYDFESLVTGSMDYYDKILQGCFFITMWKNTCSESLPFPEHRYCELTKNKDDGSNLYERLKKVYPYL